MHPIYLSNSSGLFDGGDNSTSYDEQEDLEGGSEGVVVDYEMRLVPTELRKDKLYVRIYLIWTNLIMQIVLPFVILISLNYK